MKKAAVSNRIYLDSTEDLVKSLSSTLTYTIPSSMPGRIPPTIIRNFSRLGTKVCSIPAGRFDLIPEDYEIIDNRVLAPINFPEFKHTLRASQKEIYDEINDSCIINAPVSWGKTFSAIAIASKLGQKTLVVVHTTMLRDQWVEQIEYCLGIKPNIIGSGKFSLDGPIIVSNTQTLIKYIDQIQDKFGTLILDEAHHTPSTTFSSILDKSKARYKIGLTGTLERKDGKHVIFSDYFGFTVFRPEKENYIKPHVLLVKLDNITLDNRTDNWADLVTDLEVHNFEYQKIVADLASAAAKNGHKVLVVASRVAFLEKLPDMCTQPAIFITGNIRSYSTRKELLESISDDIHIICGTMSIFSEGISQSDLSCLILATPINNAPLLTQLIGRIVRKKEGKTQPLVVDIQCGGPTGGKQARARVSHYIRNGYSMKVLKN